MRFYYFTSRFSVLSVYVMAFPCSIRTPIAVRDAVSKLINDIPHAYDWSYFTAIVFRPEPPPQLQLQFYDAMDRTVHRKFNHRRLRHLFRSLRHVFRRFH